VKKLVEAFRSLYGVSPRIYRAPGRVNLIGEHTDYNEGFVMPAAIDFSTWVAIAPRDDRKLVIRSENFSETAELDLDASENCAQGHWSDYPFGVAIILEGSGKRLRGANILLRGEVPIGSGLSSSAAIEVSIGFALIENSDLPVDRWDLAKSCRRAENEFVGIRSGLMDQFIACFGQEDRALVLDCRSLEYKPLPLPSDVNLVICNTMVKHQLAVSEYNARRAECEEGVRLLSRLLPHVNSLRDVTTGDLQRLKHELPEVIGRRCRHVASENSRVLEATSALERRDLATFGVLMRESHESLRDDYEVSCRELDLMVDLANGAEGIIGARMTGGGFGGCTINLVRSDSVEAFKKTVGQGYSNACGRVPEIYVCAASQGAESID
jgi:galactokinase